STAFRVRLKAVPAVTVAGKFFSRRPRVGSAHRGIALPVGADALRAGRGHAGPVRVQLGGGHASAPLFLNSGSVRTSLGLGHARRYTGLDSHRPGAQTERRGGAGPVGGLAWRQGPHRPPFILSSSLFRALS